MEASSEGDRDSRVLTQKLLAERLCTAVQALIDKVGVESARKAMYLHMYHGGLAASYNLKGRFTGSPMELIAKIYFFGESCMSGNNTVMEVRERGAISHTSYCVLGDGPRDLCPHLLQFSVDGMAEAIDPNYEIVSISFLSHGGPTCHKVVRKKGTSLITPDDFGPVVTRLTDNGASPEEMHWFACQYLGEWWVQVTKALIDLYGGEGTVEILKPYMRHCGMAAGMALASHLKEHGTDAASIGRMLDFYGVAMQQNGMPPVSNENVAEKEITECPFSESPAELCRQMEFISQGICEAINPEYEFVYDRMMTRGDKSCHWMVKEKSTPSLGSKDEKAVQESEDPLKALKMRFVRGEISEEEYRRMKYVLEE